MIVDFYFIGSQDGGSGFSGRWGAHYIHSYKREELPAILAECRLDLALFYPVVPETFSYTLSEVWCFGIPPLARRLGSHGERIEHGSNGFLFGLEENVLVDSLLDLDRSRDKIRAVAARLLDQPARSVSDAVCEYYLMRSDFPRRLEESLEATVRSLPVAETP